MTSSAFEHFRLKGCDQATRERRSHALGESNGQLVRVLRPWARAHEEQIFNAGSSVSAASN